MSQTVIFSLGVAVFFLTIWGVVMAGSLWIGRVAGFETARPASLPAFAERGVVDGDGAQTPTTRD